VQGWYASFLNTFVIPHPAIWAYLITFGELLVGVGMIVGCLSGIILAWRIAGYYGVDRYLLPLLGTPWTGSLRKKEEASTPATNQPVTV
jgi:thiosulfate dehydrogenase [quinone] large subunit